MQICAWQRLGKLFGLAFDCLVGHVFLLSSENVK